MLGKERKNVSKMEIKYLIRKNFATAAITDGGEQRKDGRVK